MSSDYFFHKWRTVLHRLQALVELDQEYQNTKILDKNRCLAAERLSGVLGAYIAVYNDALDCSQQNLQVQKAADICSVVKAVVGRLLELKQQLRKLEGYQPHFLGQGLIQHQLTTDDVEFQGVPLIIQREDIVKKIIAQSIERAEKKAKEQELERLREEQGPDPHSENVEKWWDEEVEEEKGGTKDMFTKMYTVVEQKSEETLTITKIASLIQGQERSRQVTRWQALKKLKRELWVKELAGNLQPQPKLELKVRGAEIIQKVFRVFMELKRKKLQTCQKDGILGIALCGETNSDKQKKVEEIIDRRKAIFKKFEREWKIQCVDIKEDYLKRKRDEICEDYRDNLRDWLHNWYKSIKFFHEIPADYKGGSAAILRGEIPSPHEWLEQYKAYLEAQKKNKNKSIQEKKLEKQAAKQEAMKAKKEEQMKKKREEQLMKKMMKNPNIHPGFRYPESKKTNDILQALEHYHVAWDDLDAGETIEVKKRSIKKIDVENMYMEAKLEVLPEVDEDMRKELKKLKVALKNDYENDGEEMPEGIKEKQRRVKKKKRVKATASELIAEKMEQLAEKGILKEYPRTKLENFIGDHNFAGDMLRCLDESASPFAGETRNIWWERCRELALGFRKILVVGPIGSGRSTLVHAMATINDAVLFELDPQQFADSTAQMVQSVSGAVASCARAAQPAVIYLKDVQRLFYKASTDGALPNSDLIRQQLIGKLFQKFQKTDKITVIGSCSDPWLARTSKLLKQFPDVILVPDTSYSVVIQLLNTWMTNNHSIPRTLDAHSLARMLRGYGFSFIKETLQHFLQPEQIVRMAAHGLFAIDILNYVLQTGTEKTDYEKYLKWYESNTTWGQRERKTLKEAREFRAIAEKYAAKRKKKTAPRLAAIPEN